MFTFESSPGIFTGVYIKKQILTSEYMKVHIFELSENDMKIRLITAVIQKKFRPERDSNPDIFF